MPTDKVTPAALRDSGVTRVRLHVRTALRESTSRTLATMFTMRALANALLVKVESTAAALVPVLALTVLEEL